MSLAIVAPSFAVWVCYPDEMNSETLGMAVCERCGGLTYGPHDDWCDLPDEWRDAELESRRADAGHPDASYREVSIMLRDEGLVSYVDPSSLYGDAFGAEEDPIAGWTWDDDGSDS